MFRRKTIIECDYFFCKVVKVKYCHSDKAQKKFASVSIWLFCKMSCLGVEPWTDKSQACPQGPSGDCFHEFSVRFFSYEGSCWAVKTQVDVFAMNPSIKI